MHPAPTQRKNKQARYLRQGQGRNGKVRNQLPSQKKYYHHWRLLQGEVQFSGMPLPVPLPSQGGLAVLTPTSPTFEPGEADAQSTQKTTTTIGGCLRESEVQFSGMPLLVPLLTYSTNSKTMRPIN
jgi:hypothetical protein